GHRSHAAAGHRQYAGRRPGAEPGAGSGAAEDGAVRGDVLPAAVRPAGRGRHGDAHRRVAASRLRGQGGGLPVGGGEPAARAEHLTARLDAHLDALLEAGILDECRSLPGDVLAFDHQLLREVVLADQEGPRAERARHRHLAAAKVQRVERGDRSLLPEVAHHYLEAREWAEAVRYHKLAGDAARDSLAFREA